MLAQRLADIISPILDHNRVRGQVMQLLISVAANRINHHLDVDFHCWA
jgi:hypothetical protein